jgi:lysophospholipase L1-like esterase
MLAHRVAQVCILLVSTSISLIVAEIAQRARHPWHAIAPLRIPAPAGQAYQVNAPSLAIQQIYGWRWISYSTDRYGHRVTPQNAAATRRVLVLGDSFTFGLYLKDQETWPSQLGVASSRDVQVLNAAVPASGLAEWVAYLEDFGALLRPQVVVLAVNYVSLSRAHGHSLYSAEGGRLLRFDPARSQYSASGPDSVGDLLAARPKPRLNWEDEFAGTSEAFRLWVEAKKKIRVRAAAKLIPAAQAAAAVPTVPAPRATDDRPYFDAAISDAAMDTFLDLLLRRAKAAADRIGSTLVVVNIGFNHQNEKLYAAGSIDGAGQRVLPAILSRQGIKYIDLSPVIASMRANGLAAWIPGDGHPTSAANQLIGQAIARDLGLTESGRQ